MENVELMKDRCQNFLLHLFELSAVFLFCGSSRVRAPICFVAFFRQKKENPALIHQTLSNSVLLLFFISANCPRLFGIKNNSLNLPKQCSKVGTYKKKLFQTFSAQLRVPGGTCGFLPSLSQWDWAVLAVGMLSQLLPCFPQLHVSLVPRLSFVILLNDAFLLKPNNKAQCRINQHYTCPISCCMSMPGFHELFYLLFFLWICGTTDVLRDHFKGEMRFSETFFTMLHIKLDR